MKKQAMVMLVLGGLTCMAQDGYIRLNSDGKELLMFPRTKGSVSVVENGETNVVVGSLDFNRQRFYNKGFNEIENTTSSTNRLTFTQEKEYKPVQTYFPAAVAVQKEQLAESRAIAAQQAAARAQVVQAQRAKAFAWQNRHVLDAMDTERSIAQTALNYMRDPSLR